MALSLKLLGEFELRDGSGAVLSLPTRKTRALLGYLAVNVDRPQPRDRLVALLWSDRGERQARHSLSQALLSIRKLGDGRDAQLLDSDGERVALRGEAIDSDIAQFRTRLSDDPAGAAVLYEGPLLDGLSIPDPAFEEWLTATRTELHGLACGALERAIDPAMDANNTQQGIELARRLVGLDPLREDAHRRLMRLLHESGDRAGALRQYQACADILKKELQVEPDAATRALFEEIKSDASASSAAEPAAPEETATSPEPPLSLPDKPSIAVLPFDNLGGDPAQDFFGDGIAEDIITELSRFHSIFVIARGSSFSFKGQSLDMRQIAHELGVRYVLEGSVRAQGPRIRISAQLIDAENGRHIWSERYDLQTEDIFSLQDELTQNIVGLIEPAIGGRERERARLGTPNHLDAWALYQQGMDHYYLANRDDLEKALALFSEAVAIAPRFATAYAMCADANFRLSLHWMPERREELLAAGLEAAQTAVRLDPLDANCHFALGRIRFLQLQFDSAIAAYDKALELNPNYAMACYSRGWALARDHPDEALEYIDRARRLSPNDPLYAGFMNVRARILFNMGRYEDAVASARIATQSPNPRFWGSAILAASLKQLGRDDEAQTALRDALRMFPDLCIGFVRSALPIWKQDQKEKFIDLLRAAGLPE